MSFERITYPHQLLRWVLVVQVYRVFSEGWQYRLV
ncbi:23S rRNA (pseudouridine(1915)-N(3))-methyltransferase RlmH [Paenibacillus plantiphilus]|nr:23S rRNA (pseudouridine(1915)-N(3))-methyltransferase RlmH [Paenibacillus plantiphilus]